MPVRDHPLYRVLLRLYPKSHRQEYAEQMVQTLDDLLAEHHGSVGKIDVWLRVALELPRTVIEEHIDNVRGINMGKRAINKKVSLAIGIIAVLVAGSLITLFISHNNDYTPTTLAKVPRSSSPPKCLQNSDDPNLHVKSDDANFIANTIGSSIIDVPAGTTFDVHLKSYSSNSAVGTAVYAGTYGRYNFIVKKTASNITNNYVGGWKITHLEVCKNS